MNDPQQPSAAGTFSDAHERSVTVGGDNAGVIATGDHPRIEQHAHVECVNQVTADVIGNVIQAGTVHGGIHVAMGHPARSAYLAHVQALAPSELSDRQAELATLAAFCTSDSTTRSYLWWKAGAWSGKSALLSWFVLHPPPRTRLVAFFVTSRLPHQNNRRAFVENVLDQLHDISGEPRHPDLTPSTREAHLRRMLTAVAEQCQQQDEHFTLLVDGLDEDRGVDGSPDAHSIAALLPESGIRVIVASRPVPDLPEDVPPHHPLRRSAVIEPLSPSPHATVARDAMIRDLKRLLTGTALSRDILGFVTAAGGGLSARDLIELTGASTWQVQEELRTVAGRSFSQHPGKPPVYVLAHDELIGMAVEMLAPELEGYRDRIHQWADSYRSRQWPPDTPHYLLDGYTSTLIDAGDLPRLLTYVTEPARQDLMHATTGQDLAALDEIQGAQAVLLRQADPDIAALTRLSVHRTSLYLRNDWIPVALPSIWAMVGEYDHAEALVAQIGDRVQRGRALLMTAREFHHAGEQDRAKRLLDMAEDLAASFNQYWGAWPWSELADTAVAIGDDARARRAADAVKHADERVSTCAGLARTALDCSRPDYADMWYREAEAALQEVGESINAPILAEMVAAAALLGRPRVELMERFHASLDPTIEDHRRTAEVDEIVSKLFSSSVPSTSSDIQEPSPPAAGLGLSDSNKAKIAKTLGLGGLFDMARAICAAIDDTDRREDCHLGLIRILAKRDLIDAEKAARSTDDVEYRIAMLATVAVSAARNDAPQQAARLLTEISQEMNDLPQGAWRDFAIMATAVAWADSGELDRAEAVVHETMLPNEDTGGALSVAVSFVRRNEIGRSASLLTKVENVARRDSQGVDQRRLVRWLRVMTDFNEFERAERLAFAFPGDEVRSAGLATLTEGLVAAGEVEWAERTLDAITDPNRQRRPRLELVRALLASHDDERAVALARAAAAPDHRAATLGIIATMTRSPALLDEIAMIAQETEDPDTRLKIFLRALAVAADLGDRSRATGFWRRAMDTIPNDTAKPSHQNRGYLSLPAGFPTRVRTLTEISEVITRYYRLKFEDDLLPVDVAGPSSLWFRGKDLPKRVRLARELATHNWFDVIEDLMEVEPTAFWALVSELDRLGSRGELHPIAT